MSSHRLSMLQSIFFFLPAAMLIDTAHGERKHKCIYPGCTKSFTRPGKYLRNLLAFSHADHARPTQATHEIDSQTRQFDHDVPRFRTVYPLFPHRLEFGVLRPYYTYFTTHSRHGEWRDRSWDIYLVVGVTLHSGLFAERKKRYLGWIYDD